MPILFHVQCELKNSDKEKGKCCFKIIHASYKVINKKYSIFREVLKIILVQPNSNSLKSPDASVENPLNKKLEHQTSQHKYLSFLIGNFIKKNRSNRTKKGTRSPL
jgi:hypothetical protein